MSNKAFLPSARRVQRVLSSLKPSVCPSIRPSVALLTWVFGFEGSYCTCILAMGPNLSLFLRSPEVILDLGGVWPQNLVNALHARVLRVGISYCTYILNMQGQQTLLILVDLDPFLRSPEVILDLAVYGLKVLLTLYTPEFWEFWSHIAHTY